MKDEILIVGAGPTGLMAALVLARKGIQPHLIDQLEAPITTSNALAIQPRTLELFEELQLIDDALAMGHKLEGITISTKNTLLGKTSFENLPTRYPFVLALAQAKLEQLLTKHLTKYGVKIHRGVTFEGFLESDSSVEVICSGEKSVYSWVLGCDGAKSDVRRSANISTKGGDLPKRFIMADLKLDWEKTSSRGHVILADDGPLAFLPLREDNFGRLIFEVSSDSRFKEAVHPTFDDFKELMQKRCPLKATLFEPSWISHFWIHSRLADFYRKKRLFIAGDAAHQHSPMGGQGLNTGVQDAYFLANLLADVIQGKKEASHLDDYEKVRRPIGRAIVHRTEVATKLITTHSRLVQCLRNVVISGVLRIPYLQQKAMMILTQLVYR